MNDLCIVIIGGKGNEKGPVSPKRRCGLPAHRQHVCVVHWHALTSTAPKRKMRKPNVQPTPAQ